jgi:hypothetical protein
MQVLRWLALAVALVQPAGAQEISTDVTVDLGGTLAADEDVVEVAGGTATPIDLGALPPNADLIGYSVTAGGDALFTLGTAASLTGGLFVTPRDVIRWNGAIHAIEFRGADHGIPVGARIDAVGVAEDGDLLLSFDVTVTLGSVTAADEDLVRLERTTPDVWSLLFDGSARGIAPGADLDGTDWIDGTGRLALSFDVSGTVAGIHFADEDILAFDLAQQSWSKHWDGSNHNPALVAADVDALLAPEPSAMALGIATAAALATLSMWAPKARRERCG